MLGARDPAWQADLARVGKPRAWLKEQSLWAIWVYRFGQRVDRLSPGVFKSTFLFVYWLLFRVVETVTGISLPKSCVMGKACASGISGAFSSIPIPSSGKTAPCGRA